MVKTRVTGQDPVGGKISDTVPVFASGFGFSENPDPVHYKTIDQSFDSRICW